MIIEKTHSANFCITLKDKEYVCLCPDDSVKKRKFIDFINDIFDLIFN